MTTSQVQYVGFRISDTSRDYRLLVHHPDGQCDEFIIAIEHEAFLSHRVRYQDGAEICFLKLRQVLEARASTPDSAPPALRQTVTEDNLREYRESHAPKPRRLAPPRPRETA
jgi:hypothetical protein